MALITALKINIVSLFALPFLLIATFVKMIERALAKIKTVAIMLLLTAVAVLIIFFANNRDILPTHIKTTLIVIAVCGVVLSILGIVFKMASVVMKIIVAGFRLIFDTIYKAAYSFYMSLVSTAADDYADLCYDISPVIAAIICVFYHLLKLINLLIIAFAGVSLFVFILASGGFAYLWYTKIKAAVAVTFGLSMGEYLGSLQTWSLISSGLLFLIIVADVAVVLVSLGLEWTGWSKELTFDDDTGDRYLDMLEDDEETFREISVEENDEDFEYYEIVSDHLLGAGDLMDEIRDAKEIKSNPLLENMSNEYFRALSDITGTIAEARGRLKE